MHPRQMSYAGAARGVNSRRDVGQRAGGQAAQFAMVFNRPLRGSPSPPAVPSAPALIPPLPGPDAGGSMSFVPQAVVTAPSFKPPLVLTASSFMAPSVTMAIAPFSNLDQTAPVAQTARKGDHVISQMYCHTCQIPKMSFCNTCTRMFCRAKSCGGTGVPCRPPPPYPGDRRQQHHQAAIGPPAHNQGAASSGSLAGFGSCGGATSAWVASGTYARQNAVAAGANYYYGIPMASGYDDGAGEYTDSTSGSDRSSDSSGTSVCTVIAAPGYSGRPVGRNLGRIGAPSSVDYNRSILHGERRAVGYERALHRRALEYATDQSFRNFRRHQ